MFHHFPRQLGTKSCLVSSTAFHYRENPQRLVHGTGCTERPQDEDDGRYLTKSLPSLDLAYTRSPLERPRPEGFEIIAVDKASLANLPAGIDGDRYRWLDLDGEGISGILSEQGDAWFYKPIWVKAGSVPPKWSRARPPVRN